MRVEFTKDSGEGATRWIIEADGIHVGDIAKECEDYANATSRARGTRAAGYSVTFDTGEFRWFAADGNARSAFESAKRYAASVASIRKGGAK